MRDGGGHAQGGFFGLLGKPDVGLPLQVGKVLGLRGKVRVLVHAQRFDAGDAEVFELLRGYLRACLRVQLGGGQVPDAVFMNQAVRVRLARLALVDELAGAVLLHGCLQLLKGAALPAQVFFRHGLHVQAPLGGAGFDLPDQPGQAGVGEQGGGACQLAVFAQVARGDGAAPGRGNAPFAFGRALGDAFEALEQIALDGAHVHAELLGELLFVEDVALVQQGDDVREALGQFFALGAGSGGCGRGGRYR